MDFLHQQINEDSNVLLYLDDTKEILSTPVVTPRQCLILSAISYYVLISSPEEITRYYVGNTRRKSTVLHYHCEAARLVGKKMHRRVSDKLECKSYVFW